MTHITNFMVEIVRDADYMINIDGEVAGFTVSRPLNIVTIKLHTDAIRPGDSGIVAELLHTLARDALRTESIQNRQQAQSTGTRHYRPDAS